MLFLITKLTALLNHWFAAPVDALLMALHIHVAHPTRPIGTAFTSQLIVMALLVLFFIAARISLNVEKPGTVQHTAEWIHEFVGGQAEQIIGHGYERFMPFVTTILLFVLICNCFGLFPGFETPT